MNSVLCNWVDREHSMIAENMSAVRIARGISTGKLAEMVDVAEITVKNIERGKVYPRLDTVIRLAAALDVTLDEYVGLQRRA